MIATLRRAARHPFFAVCWVATLLAAVTPVAQAQSQDPSHYLELLRTADAAGKAKQWTQAAALWEQIVVANPSDANNWRQLAIVQFYAKNYLRAIAANKQSIDLGSPADEFPWSVAYDIADCYEQLGDHVQALHWLDTSWNLGWRDLKAAREDDDFKALRDDQHFRDLTALVDITKMSRNDGWRYDLQLLAREIERRHYNPFRTVSQSAFQASVKALYDQIPALSDNATAVGFMRLLAVAGDGHTTLDASGGRREFRMSVPLQLYFFEEGLFIISADSEHHDLAGVQVIRIGNHTVEEVMDALTPIISRDNSMWLKTVGPAYIRRPPILNGLGLIPDGDVLPLTVREADGKVRDVTVAASIDVPRLTPDSHKDWVSVPPTAAAPTPLYRKNQAASYWFEYLPDSKILYFQFNQIKNDKDESFSIFVARMFKFIAEHDTHKLVIDMRQNGGGDTFLVKPLIDSIIRSDKINQRGKLFVIIGRQVFSAAMNTTVFLERNTHALFVGEPTGSSPNFIGETNRFNLPYSQLIPSVSDLYWESSWPMDHRVWIAPLLYIPPSFSSYRENRDPAMEAVVAYQDGH